MRLPESTHSSNGQIFWSGRDNSFCKTISQMYLRLFWERTSCLRSGASLQTVASIAWQWRNEIKEPLENALTIMWTHTLGYALYASMAIVSEGWVKSTKPSQTYIMFLAVWIPGTMPMTAPGADLRWQWLPARFASDGGQSGYYDGACDILMQNTQSLANGSFGRAECDRTQWEGLS